MVVINISADRLGLAKAGRTVPPAVLDSNPTAAVMQALEEVQDKRMMLSILEAIQVNTIVESGNMSAILYSGRTLIGYSLAC